MHVFFRILFLFSLIFCLRDNLEGKVLVMTHAFNKPAFIWWQHATLKKFLKDDYTFIVFNDAPNDNLRIKIGQMCQICKIRCINVPQKIHESSPGNPSKECAETIQYMLNTVGFHHPGIVMVLDSDMFPMRELYVEEFLQGYDVATNEQYRKGKNGPVTYFLPNLMIFNMETLPDKYSLKMDLGSIDGANVDTGGYSHYYIQAHRDLKWLKTNCFYELHPECAPEIKNYLQGYPKMFQLITEKKYDFEFYADYRFIHMRAGSNWNKYRKYAEKTECFFNGLADILRDETSPVTTL